MPLRTSRVQFPQVASRRVTIQTVEAIAATSPIPAGLRQHRRVPCVTSADHGFSTANDDDHARREHSGRPRSTACPFPRATCGDIHLEGIRQAIPDWTHWEVPGVRPRHIPQLHDPTIHEITANPSVVMMDSVSIPLWRCVATAMASPAGDRGTPGNTTGPAIARRSVSSMPSETTRTTWRAVHHDPFQWTHPDRGPHG